MCATGLNLIFGHAVSVSASGLIRVRVRAEREKFGEELEEDEEELDDDESNHVLFR